LLLKKTVNSQFLDLYSLDTYNSPNFIIALLGYLLVTSALTIIKIHTNVFSLIVDLFY